MINKILLISLIALFTNYKTVKNNAITERNTLAKSYKNSTNKAEILKVAKQIFTDILLNNIIEQWKGTAWTFDGHTETPKSGSVACGYFVSTTLRDMGINLNRYKMAQKSPENEAKHIACNSKIETLNNITKQELITHFNTKADGFYFVGLNFHVGYLLKQGKTLYFIHSNYIGSSGVMQENVENSKAIESTVYYIVGITNNTNLIKNWLNKTAI